MTRSTLFRSTAATAVAVAFALGVPAAAGQDGGAAPVTCLDPVTGVPFNAPPGDGLNVDQCDAESRSDCES